MAVPSSVIQVTLAALVPLDCHTVKTQASPSRQTVSPILTVPFAAAPLTISVAARRMEPVTATSEDAVRGAYYRAPRELLSWRLET